MSSPVQAGIAASIPTAENLLKIIQIQTEIARAGLDLGEVMALVTQQTRILTGAAGSVLELAEGEEMVYCAAAGIAESQIGLRIKKNGSLSGLCVKESNILRCDDSESDDRVDRNACRRVGLRSMLVVPLNHGNATVGVLKVVSPKISAFSDSDITILGLMSELVAAAMFHAARYQSSELHHRATHDSLTGLANRALFYDRLRLRLTHAQRHTEKVAVMNVDLDGLKPINDQFGHRAGDSAIKEVATRIHKAARRSDTVARMGGDEFAVLLARVEDAEGAQKQQVRIDKKVRTPFEFEGKPLTLSASIGVAVYPDDGATIDELMEIADQKMYAIKRSRQHHVR